jgi:thiol:disulfide interchange protein
MVAKRSTKMGKIVPYVDVRSKSDIPKFESMVHMGPVYVLVYADWCGHCQRFKENVWNDVVNSGNKTVNAAAVHYDMVDKTSMKNANIEGYPTLFEIKNTSGAPKPVPTPQSKEELETLLNENMMRSQRMYNNSQAAAEDTFVPEVVDTLPPEPEVETVAESLLTKAQSGGSLLESLLKVSADTAHAIVLTGSAIEISRRMKKRRHTKRRRSGKSKQTRRR